MYLQLTVSKFNKESTAFALAALSFSFISRRYFVRHSVIRTVMAEWKKSFVNIIISVLNKLACVKIHWIEEQILLHCLIHFSVSSHQCTKP